MFGEIEDNIDDFKGGRIFRNIEFCCWI